MKKVTKSIVLSVLCVMLAGALNNPVVNAATFNGNEATMKVTQLGAKKKDKTKPKITFKGKSKITVYKNAEVLIPKTIAKDNKDGNLTKKISLTVKKGKKNYKSLAKSIKANKKVKFTSTGKYT